MAVDTLSKALTFNTRAPHATYRARTSVQVLPTTDGLYQLDGNKTQRSIAVVIECYSPMHEICSYYNLIASRYCNVNTRLPDERRSPCVPREEIPSCKESS